MRMAGPDVVLFVVGALLFGGATYAIIASDGGLGGTSAAGVFDVTFAASEVAIDEVAVGSMRAGTADFQVNQTNVGAIIVTIACADQAGAVAPFNLQVQVSGPNGLTGEGSGACGQDATIEIPVSESPPAIAVPGSTEDEARANLPALDNATRAAGAWSVTVSGGRSAGPASALPVPVGDPSGTITLTASVWEPTFTPVQR